MRHFHRFLHSLNGGNLALHHNRHIIDLANVLLHLWNFHSLLRRLHDGIRVRNIHVLVVGPRHKVHNLLSHDLDSFSAPSVSSAPASVTPLAHP